MKKPLLWILVLLMSVLLVAVFSSGGCRRVEEVTDELEEEALDESEAEEIEEESTAKGKIAFESDRDGNWEIYIMNIDGSGQTNLTNNPAEDRYPSFSPDGSKIVFTSGSYEEDIDTYEGSDIYIMNIDGSGQTNLTNNPAEDRYPSFSPDGSKIVFMSDRDVNSNIQIYIMNVDGSEETLLAGDAMGPSFSPDGSKIVFMSDRDLYIMNVDGSEKVNLTDNPVLEWSPSFSPDGSKIVFTSGSYEEDIDAYEGGDICIMNIDGSGQTNLTNSPEYDGGSSFSPDGSKIVFMSDRGVNCEIYIMNVDGSEQVRLTNNQAYDSFYFFSPDGSKIVFMSDRDKNDEIYIMNVDGSGQTNLTNNPANDRNPSFSPY